MGTMPEQSTILREKVILLLATLQTGLMNQSLQKDDQ
jgi:hypothetical protein